MRRVRRYATAALALLVAACSANVPSAAGLDRANQSYLEGNWLVDKPPDKGACTSRWYDTIEYEFEFQKSGGRLLIFEPRDLFTVVSIPRIERVGSLFLVYGQTRDGKLRPVLRMRLLPPDRIEFLPKDDGGGSSATPAKSRFFYRCDSSNSTVNASVPMERLAVLTPSLSGAQGFPEREPGVSDRDLCQGRGLDPQKAATRRWVQFELLGPTHYWVFGWGFWPKYKLAFDYVRSVHQLDPHTLKLDMQEHLDEGEGWDVPESRGRTYQLTITDKGSQIEIPELSATFVRCKPEERGSRGMERGL